MFQTISAWQLEAYLDEKRQFTLLDVRDEAAFYEGHLEGAVNIPLEELEMRADEISRDRPVIVYCGHGSRSMQAARFLDQLGYRAASVVGGLAYYRGSHFITG